MTWVAWVAWATSKCEVKSIFTPLGLYFPTHFFAYFSRSFHTVKGEPSKATAQWETLLTTDVSRSDLHDHRGKGVD